MARYYPKSQIQPNLYTAGNEYMFHSSGKEYTGFYFRTSKGELYTGKNPTDGGSSLLIPLNLSDEQLETRLEDDVIRFIANWESVDPQGTNFLSPNSMINNERYSRINTTPSPPSRKIPTPYTFRPTNKNFKAKEAQRYFAKKTNEDVYIEISKQQFLLFKNGSNEVASDLYEVVSFPWSLSNQTSESINRKIIFQIERDNKWYGFSKYLGLAI